MQRPQVPLLPAAVKTREGQRTLTSEAQDTGHGRPGRVQERGGDSRLPGHLSVRLFLLLTSTDSDAKKTVNRGIFRHLRNKGDEIRKEIIQRGFYLQNRDADTDAEKKCMDTKAGKGVG